MKTKFPIFLSALILLSACVGDDFIEDFVEEEFQITSNVDSLQVASSIQLFTVFRNNIGQQEDVNVDWLSSDDDVIRVEQDGTVTAIAEGEVSIVARIQRPEQELSDTIHIVSTAIEVSEPDLQTTTGTIQTTTFYVLEGSFEYTETDSGVRIDIADDYEASSRLPGLYLYLSNNPNSIAGAHEVSEVTTFTGEHSYEVEGVGFSDYSYLLYYCKPFNVKVGDGKIQD